MADQPITWDDLEGGYEALITARGEVDRILLRDAGLSERQAFRLAFVRLATAVDAAMNSLTTVFNAKVAEVEIEAPARPLEAVLADIEAEGHNDITLRRSPALADWEVRSDTDALPYPGSDSSHEVLQAWRAEIEAGEARGDTPSAAAEARLAQIRELHALKWITGLFRPMEADTLIAREERRREAEASETDGEESE